MNDRSKNFQKYIDSYAGRELLKKHSLKDTGIWKILGEDPNADLGGTHYRPELGIFQGTLEDIIMYGVNLREFWTWGLGGSIVFIGKSIPKIDKNSLPERMKIEKEIEDLEEKLSQAKDRLKNF